MWLPVLAAVAYAGIIMIMRWRGNRAIEDNLRQREGEANREIVQRFGGGELKILMFYANPAQVSAGSRSLLCYGVANAASVRIEPGVEALSPSLSRCVEVRPTADTRFTLVATGASGDQAQQEVTIDVR